MMKYLFLRFMIGLMALPLTMPKSNFNDFIKFTLKNFDPPESVARICDWQYAIVKLHINSSNQIIDYEVLNKVPKEFEESLAYLKNYQFEKKMLIRKRPILFCLNIVNLRNENCDTVGPNHRKLLKGVDKLKEYQASHKLEEKSSIFIYKEFTKQIFDYQR